MPRLDAYLVDAGLARSREAAKAMIAAGQVRVGGAVARKPAARVPDGAAVQAARPDPWVSRGAHKLLAGLDAFGVEPAGRVCMDLGASTGGFTQVLLSRGAARVYAVDVGRDQLAASLRADPRVVSLEGTHARDVNDATIPEACDLLVCDVSFIGLTKALPPVLPRLAAGAAAVLLVKPQFEVGRARIGKNGLVRDQDALPAWLEAEMLPALEGIGWRVNGWTDSPIRGGDGNREFLVGAQRA